MNNEAEYNEAVGQPALRSEAAKRVYAAHGGFRKLKAYQVAELCYDYTCRFCERYVPKKDRHFDQMVQAARAVTRISARAVKTVPPVRNWR